jgi:hypothetical protein
VHTQVHTPCAHTLTCTHMCTHTCTHTYSRFTYTCAHTHTFTLTFTHTCTHSCTHTCTHETEGHAHTREDSTPQKTSIHTLTETPTLTCCNRRVWQRLSRQNFRQSNQPSTLFAKAPLCLTHSLARSITHPLVPCHSELFSFIEILVSAHTHAAHTHAAHTHAAHTHAAHAYAQLLYIGKVRERATTASGENNSDAVSARRFWV